MRNYCEDDLFRRIYFFNRVEIVFKLITSIYENIKTDSVFIICTIINIFIVYYIILYYTLFIIYYFILSYIEQTGKKEKEVLLNYYLCHKSSYEM